MQSDVYQISPKHLIPCQKIKLGHRHTTQQNRHPKFISSLNNLNNFVTKEVIA